MALRFNHMELTLPPGALASTWNFVPAGRLANVISAFS